MHLKKETDEKTLTGLVEGTLIPHKRSKNVKAETEFSIIFIMGLKSASEPNDCL